MKPDTELTARLRTAIDKMDHPEEVKPFLKMPVYTWQQAIETGQRYWGANGYAFTSLPFEEVVGCLELDNPTNPWHPGDYVNGMIILAPDGITQGVELTKGDIERLDLTATIQISDVQGKYHGWGEVFRKAFETPELQTHLSQPGGSTKIPGNLFNRLYELTQRRKAPLVLKQVVSDLKDWSGNGKEFYVASLP